MSDYTTPDRPKLKMLWLQRDYATADEQREAAIKFDEYMARLDQAQPVTKRDRQWFLGEHAGCDCPVPHDHEDNELVIHPDYHWKRPKTREERKNASEQMLELMFELDAAVEMIPARISKYRQLLADQGLDSAAIKVDTLGDPIGGDSGRQGMAGVNVADQGALQYHEILLGMATQFAQMVVHENQFESDNGPSDS